MNTTSFPSSPATAGTPRFFPSSLRLAALTAALLLTTLTARAQTTYTVTFDANGGEGNMNPQTVMPGIIQELTPNAYTFAPYHFLGWNTRADGTGTDYADEQEITVTGDMTLYAQWFGKIYTFNNTDNLEINNLDAKPTTSSVVGDTPVNPTLTPNDQKISQVTAIPEVASPSIKYNSFTIEVGNPVLPTGKWTTYVAPTKVILSHEKAYSGIAANLANIDGSINIRLSNSRKRGADTTNENTITLENRDILTGTGGENTKVVIRDGATVTLRSVKKRGGEESNPGIECEGDATIILCGDNYVTGDLNGVGIYVPKDKTLTIRGSGSLTATGGDDGHYPGIGGGEGQDCGNIVISDEVRQVIANGNPFCIGPSSGCRCGTITIGGEVTGPINGPSFTYSSGLPLNIPEVNSPEQVHMPTTITLDSNSGDVELYYGDVLTGTGDGDTHVIIKDGATVTLNNVTNTRVTQRWAGITCAGDATLILTGVNNVEGGLNSPAIFVPEGKTLTIRGDGTLNATGGGFSAGIGGDYNGDQSCGNIVIEGGNIVATGGIYAAGIGGAYNGSCGNITIGEGIKSVTATIKVSSNENQVPIGKGHNGSCGSVSIAPGLMDEMSGSTRTICPPPYPVWLGDVQVSPVNRDDILGDGTTSFDPTTNTLSLDHPTVDMAIRSEGIDLTMEGVYTMTNAVDGVALDVKGGTLTMEGSFTLRGSVNGVEVDNNVTLKGALRAAGTSGAGIRYTGTADDCTLTMVPGFVGHSLVEMKGGTAALSHTDGHYFRFTTNGYRLVEPADGIIAQMPYDILDAQHETATHAMLALEGTAMGDGTESNPYQINSAEDWAKACEDVMYGLETAGKYFRIGSSFTATSVMGPMDNPFAGVLDGGSEYFIVTADIDKEYVANGLFYAVNGATIRNLHVNGIVRGGLNSSGIVGMAVGGETTLENCIFSGTVSTEGSSPAYNWIIGAKSEDATVTAVNCLDASQHHWGTGVNAYSVTGGTNISLTKTDGIGVVYDKSVWAPKDAMVNFTLSGGDGSYAPTAGTLTSSEGVYSMMMSEEDVLILPNSFVSHDISYPGKDEGHPVVNGGTVSTKGSAPAGKYVLINVTPDPCYLLDELTVTTDPGGGATGEPVEVDYDHFFRMPASDVIVSATFKKKYSYENGVLHLLCGDFKSSDKWGSDVPSGSVTSVVADAGVRFVGFCGDLFSGFTSCTSMDLSNVETSFMSSAQDMFYNCSALKSLNLSGWNTAQVRDMSEMFEGCSVLGELDLSGFVFTSGVDVTGMFSMNGLYKLTLPPAFSVTKEMALNKGSHDAHWNYSGWQLLGNKKVVSTVSDAVYDSNNNAFTYAQLPGQLTVPTFVWKELPDDFVLELPDGQDNRDLIALWDGLTVNVKLTGRTLYKDGYWNTLCLPFTLSEALDASYPVLSGAEFKRLDVDGKYNGQGQEYFGGDEQNEADYTIQTGFDEATGALNLFFKDGDFEAGTPLLVKWDPGEDIVSPTFNKVTITKTLNDVNSGDGIVTFRGNYDYRSFPAADRSILFLGGDDKLYYPGSGARIGPSRSYFKLVGVTVGDLPSSSIQMHFGGGDATSVAYSYPLPEGKGTWFDLAGRRIDSVPTAPGIYIKDGKKIIVK